MGWVKPFAQNKCLSNCQIPPTWTHATIQSRIEVQNWPQTAQRTSVQTEKNLQQQSLVSLAEKDLGWFSRWTTTTLSRPPWWGLYPYGLLVRWQCHFPSTTNEGRVNMVTDHCIGQPSMSTLAILALLSSLFPLLFADLVMVGQLTKKRATSELLPTRLQLARMLLTGCCFQ